MKIVQMSNNPVSPSLPQSESQDKTQEGTMFPLSHRPNNPHRSRRIALQANDDKFPIKPKNPVQIKTQKKQISGHLPFFSPAIVVSFGVWSCYACRISKSKDPARYFLSERDLCGCASGVLRAGQ